MSDYTHKPGGSLKFKGEGEKKKKKKSKPSASTSTDHAAVSASSSRERDGGSREREHHHDRDGAERRPRRDSRSASPSRRDRESRNGRQHDEDGRGRRGSDEVAYVDEDEGAEGRRSGKVDVPGSRGMTETEKRFLEVQRQREEVKLIVQRAERVAKGAHLTHKERVTEFNSKLDKLTEHNDIPKISWTG